jgi:hypothetical protein
VILNKIDGGSWVLDDPKLASKILERQEQKQKTSLLLGSGKYDFSFVAN